MQRQIELCRAELCDVLHCTLLSCLGKEFMHVQILNSYDPHAGLALK